ncbi:putative GPI-anchored wall transfer protein [Vairimorpha necatrix]|uniref:GPI-anchored wall transfer protein n=1 Tax=Vairimorpha necatrix TaxID=6039 RepID=A0AAX4JCD8_9MICR
MSFSSESEIFIVTGISNLSLLAYNTFPCHNIILDFVFWICPQYYIIMYPNQKTELICLLILLINFNKIKAKQPTLLCKDMNFSIIRILRSYLACQTAICILAADFIRMFPAKFGKSLDYGFKLMDIGVGSYIYNCGLMINKTKVTTNLKINITTNHNKETDVNNYIKTLPQDKVKRIINKNILILLILGLIRYMTICVFNLQVEVAEYGVHSNFYFILALVQFIYKIFPYNKLGYPLLIIYQIVTRHYKIDKFILNNNRHGFIFQNKETFFVIIPFLCLMMILQDISRILFYPFLINQNNVKEAKLDNLKYKILNLSKYLGIFYLLYRMFAYFEDPSRRLCNATYVFFILYLHTAHLLIYIFVSILTHFQNYTTLDFVSKNMMTNFLLTNLLVLFFKQIIEFKDNQCHWVIIFYLILSFTLPPIISRSFNINKI